MDNICYAIATKGLYEDYSMFFIKIYESEKDKIIQFCKDTKHIGEINIHGFVPTIEILDVNYH